MRKKLKIAILSPFEETVPPEKYGGTELVVYNLVEGLTRRGHKVTLLASGDSRVSARLIPIFKEPLRGKGGMSDLKTREAYKFVGVARVIEFLKGEEFDVVHNHIGWRILTFSRLISYPLITTLHGPLDIGYQQFVYSQFPKANYISISNNQRKPLAHKLNFVATVYNGIEVEKFTFINRPGEYLAFLGRMSSEKGPIHAIEVAKRSGMKLVMAAKVDLTDQKFYQGEVEPLIDGKQIKFIGEVDHVGKNRLLKNAAALLVPIQWEEPFGLYMIEAMACGTPVIAFDRGAVREIVVDGRTGFICKNISEMTEAVKRIGEINREDCRKHVEKNFTVQKMVDGYEEAFKKLVFNY